MIIVIVPAKIVPAKIVIFDLEVWSDEGVAARGWSGPDENPDIVACGAILYNLKKSKVEKKFQCLVKLITHEALSDYFTALTGIKQEEIDEHGIKFKKFLNNFFIFCANYEIYFFDSRIDGSRRFDLDMLLRNCQMLKIDFPMDEQKFHNINAEIFDPGLAVKQSGESPRTVGKEPYGKAHNPFNDAMGLAITLQELVKRGYVKIKR